MPQAEVGFSAPERPFVESRYNQLKGPWYGGPWYGMQGGIGGKVFRGNGRGKVERWGGEGGFWLWVSNLEAHLGQSLTAG